MEPKNHVNLATRSGVMAFFQWKSKMKSAVPQSILLIFMYQSVQWRLTAVVMIQSISFYITLLSAIMAGGKVYVHCSKDSKVECFTLGPPGSESIWHEVKRTIGRRILRKLWNVLWGFRAWASTVRKLLFFKWDTCWPPWTQLWLSSIDVHFSCQWKSQHKHTAFPTHLCLLG